MKFSIKKAFTLIEMMLVITMISIGVMSIIQVIDYGLKFSDKTKKRVIAINIAREGIEMVYNIRETNRLRRSGYPEQCRLKTNPVSDGGDGCLNDDWIGSGSYILSGITITNNQQIFSLSGINGELKINNNGNIFIDETDKKFALCKDAKGFWFNCPNQNQSIDDGRYFRMIKGVGMYDKNPSGGTSPNSMKLISCPNGNACGTNAPKEFRFCSKVEYVGNGTNDVELCAILTNFKKQQ